MRVHVCKPARPYPLLVVGITQMLYGVDQGDILGCLVLAPVKPQENAYGPDVQPQCCVWLLEGKEGDKRRLCWPILGAWCCSKLRAHLLNACVALLFQLLGSRQLVLHTGLAVRLHILV